MKPRERRKTTAIIVVLAALFVLAGCYWLFLRQSPAERTGECVNSSNNLIGNPDICP